MKNIFFLILIAWVFNACKVSNTALNDNNTKAKNAKLVPTTKAVNLLRTKFLENGNSFRIYGSFLSNDSLDADSFLAKYACQYAFLFDYANKEKAEMRNAVINESSIFVKNKLIHFYIDIPKPKTELGIVTLKLELNDRAKSIKMQNELGIRFNSLKTSDSFALFGLNNDHIVLNNFISLSDSVIIKSNDGTDRKFTVVRYKHEFDAALSPLAVGQRPNPKPLYVDSLYEVNTNTPFVLSEEGMYYFIKDTTDRSGFSVLAVDERFPRYTQPAKLTKPLVYMTTSSEYLNLNATQDHKKSLDQFWLSLYNGNQGQAKRSIKNIYKKVEEANTMFSNYKEGWKTDKGMVYIVMGMPDNVRYLKDKEVWVYTKNARFSEINFTFNKRPNQFIEDHYELSRFSEFQPIWFPAVENLRNGENL
jgi:GWxTD domain-containing protein